MASEAEARPWMPGGCATDRIKRTKWSAAVCLGETSRRDASNGRKQWER
jgi:hypothetical protein